MPLLNESSAIVVIASLANDAEPTTYDELIASTLRRTTWIHLHLGYATAQSGNPEARIDIATGLVNEEQDLIPDLGAHYTGGTGNAGMGHICTSFPFVIEAGVRLSARVRADVSGARNFNIAIRLIQ